MNIFYLDASPLVSAQAMTNKHVVKMILETAQLLSTAHHVLDGDASPFTADLYKITHQNHPSAIWTRESYQNYTWLYEHFIALCEEYKIRYKKTHKTEKVLKDILSHTPMHIPYRPATPIRIAIANTQHHKPDPIASYRAYYEAEKLKVPVDIERYYNILGGTKHA